MYKTDLVAVVADSTGMSKERAGDVVAIILDEITNALSRAERVSVIGFGSFSQSHRKARQGRSPRTGETIHIPANTSVGFKPGKALKKVLNE